VLEQYADYLYTQTLLEFLIAHVVAQIGVELDDAPAHTGRAFHLAILGHAMGAEG
jgi:hypothetical protein